MRIQGGTNLVRLIAPALAAVVLGLVTPSHAQTDKNERTATPSKGLLWGSKMTLESEACCAALPGAKQPDRAEAAVLVTIPDRALRDGPILKLKLQGGRTLKITDCDVEDACEAERFRTHRLAAWWPALGTYVVNVKLYQGGLAYLVSERTGQTTNVVAAPVLSPSGRRALALRGDGSAGDHRLHGRFAQGDRSIRRAALCRRCTGVARTKAGVGRRFACPLRRRLERETAFAHRGRQGGLAMLRAKGVEA